VACACGTPPLRCTIRRGSHAQMLPTGLARPLAPAKSCACARSPLRCHLLMDDYGRAPCPCPWFPRHRHTNAQRLGGHMLHDDRSQKKNCLLAIKSMSYKASLSGDFMSLFLTHLNFRNSAEEFYLYKTLSVPIKLLSSLSSLI
jgi:hypothetical protein